MVYITLYGDLSALDLWSAEVQCKQNDNFLSHKTRRRSVIKSFNKNDITQV